MCWFELGVGGQRVGVREQQVDLFVVVVDELQRGVVLVRGAGWCAQ